MAFSINPEVLNGQADALEALADDVPPANTYLSDHLSLELPDTTFWFYQAATAAQDVRDAIQGLLTEVETALNASGMELDAVAQRSLDLDDSIEAELDAAYPDQVSSSSPTTVPSNQSVHTKPAPPADALVAPASEPATDLVSQILTTDWLSPSDIVSQIIEWIFDWNPIDEVMRKFTGDWDAMFRVSSAATNVSTFVSRQGQGVTDAISVCASSWTGNAADAANVFFTEFASMLQEAADEIAKAGPQFEAVARGMRDTADTVSGFFNLIIDLAIAAAVFYAAGIATGATVIGPIIGFIGGTGSLAYMAWLAEKHGRRSRPLNSSSTPWGRRSGSFSSSSSTTPNSRRPSRTTTRRSDARSAQSRRAGSGRRSP